MEFSGQYGTAPAFGAQTKGLMYQFASYRGAGGAEVPGGRSGMGAIALHRAMIDGPVHARLDQADASLHEAMRWSQPNFFLPFDKAGVDPFRDWFPIRAVLEGTVRGTGGLRVVDDGCATTVPGLFAAGDTATRENVTGGISGGGSHNGAWAISSGGFAGHAAAVFARDAATRRPVTPTGAAGLRPRRPGRQARSTSEVVSTVQQRVFPLELNRFRTAAGLRESLAILDPLWEEVRDGLAPSGRPGTHSRQAAGLVAHARWMYRSALARTESRAMHLRDDRPATDPGQAHRLHVDGLDEITVSPATATLTTARAS